MPRHAGHARGLVSNRWWSTMLHASGREIHDTHSEPVTPFLRESSLINRLEVNMHATSQTQIARSVGFGKLNGLVRSTVEIARSVVKALNFAAPVIDLLVRFWV